MEQKLKRQNNTNKMKKERYDEETKLAYTTKLLLVLMLRLMALLLWSSLILPLVPLVASARPTRTTIVTLPHPITTQ